jgi:hypothetical protein
MILFGEDALHEGGEGIHDCWMDATPTKRSMCAVVMMQFFPFVDKKLWGC